MTVAELQQYFENLARVVRAAPAAKAADELELIGRGLAPFRSMSLKDFSEFLVRADEFVRTGQVSAAPTRGRGRAPTGRSGGARTKPDAATIAQEAKRLYDRAATASVSEADLQALAANLNKLIKNEMKAVGAAIDLTLTDSTKKPEMIRRIQAKIEGRQGSKQRSGMTSLPATDPAEANGAETFASSGGVPVSSL
jgi:hypothetical protein